MIVFIIHRDISHDQGFVDETRYILRYALSIILERSKKVGKCF